MTVKELYERAKRQGIEDYDLVTRFEIDKEVNSKRFDLVVEGIQDTSNSQGEIILNGELYEMDEHL